MFKLTVQIGKGFKLTVSAPLLTLALVAILLLQSRA